MKTKKKEVIIASEWYYKVFKVFTPIDRTVKEVDGFIQLCHENNLLPSNPIDISILDICCGYGRHSIELAKRGFNISGVDISPPLIEQAKSDAKKESIDFDNLTFKVGDIRDIPFPGESFGAIINMYTSFGNYSDEENIKCMYEINRVIKPSGFVFFDLNNLFYFINSNRIGKHFYKDGHLLYLEESSFNPIEGREHQTAEYYYKGVLKHKYNLSLRRYTFTEFRSLLESTGFKSIAVYGDFDGSLFEVCPPSKRMIIIAKKM